MEPLWGVLLRQRAEEPAQPTVGPEGPGLKWLLGLLGTGQRVSWSGSHRALLTTLPALNLFHFSFQKPAQDPV